MTIYRSTDTTVLAHHKEECIECQSSDISETSAPSSDEVYECESCGVVISISEGEVIARGDLSSSTMDSFSFDEKF